MGLHTRTAWSIGVEVPRRRPSGEGTGSSEALGVGQSLATRPVCVQLHWRGAYGCTKVCSATGGGSCASSCLGVDAQFSQGLGKCRDMGLPEKVYLYLGLQASEECTSPRRRLGWVASKTGPGNGPRSPRLTLSDGFRLGQLGSGTRRFRK